MRVLLDANVLVSGIAFPNSVQAEVIDRWTVRAFQLIVSEHLRQEVLNALRKKYFLDRVESNLEHDARIVMEKAEVAEVSRRVDGVATHPEDDLILAAGLSGEVDLLVTGDKQLLKLGRVEGVRIVDSRTFLAMLDEEA